MREVLLTSSALILALLVLRRVFRKRISRRVQYALWGLVLLRLLVPVNLPAADFSVLSVSEPARVQMEERLEEEPVYVLPVSTQEIARSSARPNVILPMEGRYSEVTQAEGGPAVLTKYAFTLEEALGLVWVAGMGCMGLWLAASNLRFWHMLRKKRIPMELPECRYPVYLVEEGLVSPCLFGLFRPAVYLTPAAMESGEGLRHVLAHEETHGRHGDPLWSLLRSVCLAVYWFDPLVWWAAAAAREDCELACDESALRRLGEGERIPYGQTLLRLIPLQKLSGGMLLTATTMTSDKKRMTERITRIAENRKMRAAALCAALAVTAGVCAVTFTGCVAHGRGAVPLTQEELDSFNTEYFNPDVPDMVYTDGGYLCPAAMRNMFLSSLYETPENIDLFELVYNGITLLPDVKKPPRADKAVILERVYEGNWPDCAAYEVSSAELDALLLEYTGVPLEKTNKVGLPKANELAQEKGYLTYLEDYDTYYWCHGDTNYRGEVIFQSGEREGDLIRLIYDDTFYGDGVKCVTLRDVGEGKYHFVSNLPYEPSASPENLNAPSDRQSSQPVGPEGRPVDMLTIPLTDALSYELEKVETYSANDLMPGHHSGEHEDRRQGRHHTGGGCRTTENCGTFAWNYGGNTYVSCQDLRLSSFPDDYFLCIPEQTYREEAFTNILGYSGVMIDYNARDPETDYYGSFCDYYVFEEGASGTDVYLLARVCGVPEVADLNGDGTLELIGTDCNGMAQIFFKRDGKLHEANIGNLLSEYWTEASSFQFLGWYTADRYLKVYAGVPVVKDGQVTDVLATAYREIYFNGQSLQVAKGQREMANHLLAGVQDMSVVVDAARTAAEANAKAWTANYGKGMEVPPEWDDYCVTALDLVYPVEFAAGQPENGVGIAVYEFRYDIHTTTPERVTPLTGGAYLDEDGWVGGFYDPNGSYLVFQILDDGSYKQLDGTISHDLGPETSEFMADLERVLSDNGLTSARSF